MELLDAADILAEADINAGIDGAELFPSLDHSGVTGRLDTTVLLSLLAPGLFEPF